MALMTVDNDVTGDFGAKPRWSAGRKMDVVLRLLRGEQLEELSRELSVEAHRIAAWRDEFLDGGKEALKGRAPSTPDDRRIREAERKIGELTLENLAPVVPGPTLTGRRCEPTANHRVPKRSAKVPRACRPT
jgi:transposase